MSFVLVCDTCSEIGDPGPVASLAAARGALSAKGWRTGAIEMCPACLDHARRMRDAVRDLLRSDTPDAPSGAAGNSSERTTTSTTEG